jgi:hypothetical protein
MTEMFTGATLSTANYDALLNGWSALTLQPNVAFNAGNSTYCNGEAAKTSIMNNFNWTITDGGLDCSKAFGKAWRGRIHALLWVWFLASVRRVREEHGDNVKEPIWSIDLLLF